MNANNIPAGYVLVPREPTDEMLAAGFNCTNYGTTVESDIERAWSAMIDSAPSTADLVAHEAPNASDNGACVQPASDWTKLLDALAPSRTLYGREGEAFDAGFRNAIAAVRALATPPAAPVVAEPALTERVERLKAAVEGELDGVALEDYQALAILDHLDAADAPKVAEAGQVEANLEGLADLWDQSALDTASTASWNEYQKGLAEGLRQASRDLRSSLAATPASPQAPAPQAVIEEASGHHGLDTAERVCFYEQDFYVLSNFSSFNLRLHGFDWPTSEHAYHGEKFRNLRGDIADLIARAPSAHEAFKIAERYRHNRRRDWDEVKVEIMRDILREKARQHEYVRRKLLATGDRELVENSWRDDYWGWGPNRDGQNMLGKLWMEVRAELRGAATAPSAAPHQGADALREALVWKWGYEYLQSRMESIGRNGWAHDCDEEIQYRIGANK